LWAADIGGNLQVAHVTAVPTSYCPPSDGQSGCLRGPDVFISNTTVTGDGQFSDNAAALEISSNRFGGNLLLKNTTTPDCGCFPKTAEVVSNQVGNDLDCENNQPPPTSSGNTAKRYRGQCL